MSTETVTAVTMAPYAKVGIRTTTCPSPERSDKPRMRKIWVGSNPSVTCGKRRSHTNASRSAECSARCPRKSCGWCGGTARWYIWMMQHTRSKRERERWLRAASWLSIFTRCGLHTRTANSQTSEMPAPISGLVIGVSSRSGTNDKNPAVWGETVNRVVSE